MGKLEMLSARLIAAYHWDNNPCSLFYSGMVPDEVSAVECASMRHYEQCMEDFIAYANKVPGLVKSGPVIAAAMLLAEESTF